MGVNAHKHGDTLGVNAQKEAKLEMIDCLVSFDWAYNYALWAGKPLASLSDLLMDRDFILEHWNKKSAHENRFFVDPSSLIPYLPKIPKFESSDTRLPHFFINREEKLLEAVSDELIHKINKYDRIFLVGDVNKAVMHELPLFVVLGADLDSSRFNVYGPGNKDTAIFGYTIKHKGYPLILSNTEPSSETEIEETRKKFYMARKERYSMVLDELKAAMEKAENAINTFNQNYEEQIEKLAKLRR